MWGRCTSACARFPLFRPFVHFYKDHTAQVRFFALTTLMLLFVLLLLATVVTVTNLDPKGKVSTGSGVVRTYYIAAEEITWDYAPSGINQVTGRAFEGTEAFYATSGPDRIGSRYTKAVFREYTDGSFAQPKPVATQHAHLGILGPVLFAETQDTLRVVFRNRASRPYNVLVEGVANAAASDFFVPAANTSVTSANWVLPGEEYIYTWNVNVGPSKDSRPPSSVWSYYSRASPYDQYAGLAGILVVTYPGNLVSKVDSATGVKYWGLKDVNQEIFTLFGTFDENLSPYLAQNMATYLANDSSVDPANATFQESNRKYTINGYLYGNLPVALNITAQATTRWHLVALNGRGDLHRPFWPGRLGDLTLSEAAAIYTLDSVTLYPGDEKIADMRAKTVGRSVLMDQVMQNTEGGMIVAYTVVPKDS